MVLYKYKLFTKLIKTGDKMLKIGNIEIKNNVLLAPMAGISNPSFFKIVEKMNVGAVFTELISAEAIVRNNQKTFDMLNGIEEIKVPVGVQLFGSDKDTISKAAKILTDKYKNIFIDINMGCPVPKVAIKAKAGSALLKDENKAYEIVKAVVNSIDRPVTVKIRSGFDSNHINAVSIAKKIELAGASLITVHPRTRAQGYSGLADWNIIKQVKENVNIPVIGNGDIRTCFDAKKMIEETNCDGVMLARGVLGNPWLIKECIDYLNSNTLPKEITKDEKLDMMLTHLDYLIKFKPERLAILEMRTLASYYLKGLEKSIKIKEEIFKATTKEEFKTIIENYRNT